MVVGFLNSIFFKYQLTVFLPAGCTGPAKAMVNNSGLGQIKTKMKRATIYRAMNIKRGKYFQTAGKNKNKVNF